MLQRHGLHFSDRLSLFDHITHQHGMHIYINTYIGRWVCAINLVNTTLYRNLKNFVSAVPHVNSTYVICVCILEVNVGTSQKFHDERHFVMNNLVLKIFEWEASTKTEVEKKKKKTEVEPL